MRMQSNGAGGVTPEIAQLAERVARTPLSAGNDQEKQRLADEDRARTREQLGLWLVARKCLADGTRADVGHRLAERAIAAAELLKERELLASMLRESGQLAIERADKASAERHFRLLLDALLGNVAEAASFGKRIKPVDIESFQQIVSLAELAAKNEMPELSLECIREALRGGPPIPDVASELARQSIGGYGTTSGRLVITQMGVAGASELPGLGQEARAVAAALTRLDDLWNRHEVPTKDIYEALAVAVLPEGRPNELFHYTLGETGDESSGAPGRPVPVRRPSLFGIFFGGMKTGPQHKIRNGVAHRLIRRAVEANAVSDLRDRVKQRAAQPLAALPAHVFLAQLGIESGDVSMADDSLDWLAERLAHDSQPHTIQLAALAAVPALKSEKHSSRGAALVEQIAAAAESQNDVATLQHMKVLLSQAHAEPEKRQHEDETD
jgi:hypothetical protein